MTTLLRFLLVVPFGFVAACFAASFALLWPFLDTRGLAASDPIYWIEAGFGFLAQAAQIGSTILIPWAVFMAVTEFFALSSILLHVTAGFGGAVLLIIGAYGGNGPHMSVQTAIIAAALTFALVYWLVAGRAAGRWRRRRSARGSSDPTAV